VRVPRFSTVSGEFLMRRDARNGRFKGHDACRASGVRAAGLTDLGAREKVRRYRSWPMPKRCLPIGRAACTRPDWRKSILFAITTSRPTKHVVSHCKIAVIPENPTVFLGTPTKDPIVTHAVGVFRDSRTIDGTTFSSQEVNRFIGIGFNWPAAAQIASKAAQNSNHLWDDTCGPAIRSIPRNEGFRRH
jgi:hypothetical protein